VIVYEVNLLVDEAVAGDYGEWLDEHIAEMLALPGFKSAEWFEDSEAHPSGRSWSIRYRLENVAAMDRYLNEFAPAMRADGMARFGSRFSASRRVLRSRRIYPGS